LIAFLVEILDENLIFGLSLVGKSNQDISHGVTSIISPIPWFN
jgi:hypothetical protein